MFTLAVAITALAGAGIAVAAQMRRQRGEIMSLRRQVLDLTGALEREASGHEGFEMPGDVLENIENDDCRMAGNLGQLNHLLDQLNGLLQGGRDCGSIEAKGFSYHDHWQMPPHDPEEFESNEEITKFLQLPPISDEEITSTDWEHLFKRIQSDHLGRGGP